MRLAFITDIHFGRLTHGAVDALLADLTTQKPDMILIGGDVTQRGFASQYHACADFIRTLPAPHLCVIGNHDVPAWNLLQRFFAPYAPYQQHITRDLNPAFVNDTTAILGINSARRMMREWAWEQGSIAPWQLDMAADFFAQHPDKTKIIVTHHPVVHPPDHPTRMLVENHATAEAAFNALGIHIVCTGHLHRASVQQIGKTHYVMGGTATCNRLRGEPNSYWMMDTTSFNFTLRSFDGARFN